MAPLSIFAEAIEIKPMAEARVKPHVQPSSKAHEGVLATFRSLLEFLVVALFALTFILQPFRIPSESMVPTLQVGDFLMVDKQSFEPEGALGWLLPPTTIHRGDLAVFHFPVDPSMHLVKRVIGLPGDHIRLQNGHVLINGVPLNEPYAFYSPAAPNNFRDNFPTLGETDSNMDPAWWIELRRSIVKGDLIVPPHSLFVLGDNRNDSEDSRYWGFVPESDLVGRPFLVYFTLPQPEPESPQQSTGERPRRAFDAHILR